MQRQRSGGRRARLLVPALVGRGVPGAAAGGARWSARRGATSSSQLTDPERPRGAAAVAGDLAGRPRAWCVALGVPLAWAAGPGRLPRPVAGPGPRRSCRWCCRPVVGGVALLARSAARGLVGGPLRRGLRHHDPVHHVRRRARPHLRGAAVLRARRRGRAARRRPGVRRRGGHPRRRAGGRRSGRVRCRWRAPGLLAGLRARLGPRPRGVRRHDHVRRQLPGHHPDDAAARSTSRCRPTPTPPSCWA